MADNNRDASIRRINRKLNRLDDSIDDIYRATYMTRVDNRNDMERISDSIENNLDNLLSTVNGQSISDLSSLILRLQRKSNIGVTDVQRSLEQMISDNTILDTINMENIQKYIQAENYQYDLILKYMPKLYEAIEIMKDNVLSSDNFTKDFINTIINKSNKEALATTTSRCDKIKEKYEIQDLFEEMYMDTAIYGEYFLYHVPYKQGLDRLQKRKQSITRFESATGELISESKQIIFEGSRLQDYIPEYKSLFDPKYSEIIQKGEGNVILKMDPYNIIPSDIEQIQEAEKVLGKYQSLTEEYVTEDADNSNNFDRGILQYDPMPVSALATDGFVNKNGERREVKIKNISGSVIHKIERDQIIPIYIGDFCIGYYYFDIINDYVTKQLITGNQYNSLLATSRIEDTDLDRQQDMLLGRLCGDIARAIDNKFINANVDLKEEIYAILRYNDQFNALYGTNTITVSFLPVEDVHHFYFKLNKKTHRGISDLEKAVVPAMLYNLLYLNDIVNKVSRAQDHRVYYVKQNVEQNVARTMLNVINQIKKGNMGMRQLENMNTIFNVIGKYNDFIVPMSQSGDTPIQFEIMQGQQSDTPTDLMDRMEEAAVNSTDVPIEFVNSVNQVDFATRFTMSNSKFLRKVFKRQRVCQEHFTKIFRKLYNYEYGTNENSIKILLPAPSFLTMTNSQQLVDNVRNFAQSLAEVELSNEEDLKPEFIKLLVHNYLGTYVDYDNINAIIDQARQQKSIEDSRRDSVDDGGNMGYDDMGGGEY